MNAATAKKLVRTGCRLRDEGSDAPLQKDNMEALIPGTSAPANDKVHQIMKRMAFILTGLVGAIGGATHASAHEPIEGTWKNRPNTLVVKIAPCGEALCGTVIQATEDAKKSVRKAGTASLVGTEVLTGLHRSAADTYTGEVFNPNLNIHASGTVMLVSSRVLVVKGCVLAGLICRQQHWMRIN